MAIASGVPVVMAGRPDGWELLLGIETCVVACVLQFQVLFAGCQDLKFLLIHYLT